MHSPLQSHFKAALRVLRYLKGSPGCGIQFYKNSDLKIKACADADWAKCPKIRRVHKESVSKQGRKFAKGESSVQGNPLFDEIPKDTVDHMETENAQDEGRTREMVDEDKEVDENILSTEEVVSTDKEVVSTDKAKVSTDRPIVSTNRYKISTDEQIESTDEHIEGTDEHTEGTEEQFESTDGQRKGTEDHAEEEIAAHGKEKYTEDHTEEKRATQALKHLPSTMSQSDRLTATQIDDQNWSEGNFQNSVPSTSQSSLTQNNDEVQTPVLRRSERQSKLPVRLNDYVHNSNVKYGIEKYVNYSKLNRVNLCFATNLNKSIEPTCLSEAMYDPNWIEAMNNEIEALNRNNTWYICDLLVGRKPIGSKWIWKIKYKASGDIERYKARLVAKGFSQREGFDYDETFSPVVKIVTVRCLITLVVVNNWPLYQLDVNNAFLYGDLNEDVYMTLPDGYNDENKSKVCKLNKSLYGLKQSPRQLNAKLTTALTEHGFEQSKFDYSLYTKHNGDKFIALLVYVDDIIITKNDNIGIKEFKVFLSTKFLIKDLGVLKYFLGIEVVENDLGLCMSQRKYCLELLHEYGLLAARPVDIPLPENTIISFEETTNDKYLSNFTTYQKLVEKLIYLTNTRPDISYAVHCLIQHMHSPLQSHFKAALRVLRYLKGSPGCGIQFYKNSDLKIKACADADWAKCPKIRRSMSSASCEVVWLGNLLHNIGLKDFYPVELFCDNSSAIQIAANLVFHERTKHFELDVHFVREKVLAGIINTVIVSSDLQTADVLTKCLGVVQHRLCCKNLGMLDIFAGDLVGKDSGRKNCSRKKKSSSSA
ncbi:ribonuclease H-like domain-containing protein [Tanacetum coccineum]